jgi:hypothetical protein
MAARTLISIPCAKKLWISSGDAPVSRCTSATRRSKLARDSSATSGSAAAAACW